MKRLKQYLDDHELTQLQFAERMKVTQPTVWAWVNDARCPNRDMLKKLSNVTGLTIDELLDHETPKQPVALRSASAR
jgi:transcriptional regulator with XRE-family HTH domain